VLRLDHVVYAVRDLDAAAGRLRRDLGLDSVPGGRHPGWGTANVIVPLGDGYVELISAVDRDEAAASVFGRQVLEATEDGEGPFAICASTDDLDRIAARLGIEISEGSRERPDGSVLRWRSVGLEDPRRQPWMPFFITWDAPAELHPGRARAGHGVRASSLARVEVSGDPEVLGGWLGGEVLPMTFVGGPAGIRAVVIATQDGEILLR
jgi:hypothetical protein